MKRSRTYTPELREEAVKLVVTQGLTLEDAALRLTIPKCTLANWVAAATSGTSSKVAPGSRSVPELETEGQASHGRPVHHFVTSPGFRLRFSNVSSMDVYEIVKRNASWKRRGRVVGGEDALRDTTGTFNKFNLDGFCNSYQVLTYGRAI